MSICRMLCTNNTKAQFCSTGHNLCSEAELLIKCKVMLWGALHPSTMAELKTKMCQTGLNQNEEETLSALEPQLKDAEVLPTMS